MLDRIVILGSLLTAAVIASLFATAPTTVVAGQSASVNEVREVAQPIKTESRFGSELVIKDIVIERQVITKDDPEVEYGEETILQEGKDGLKSVTTKITFYEGKEFSREIVDTQITQAEDKIISKGTKIVWRTLDTPEGQIRYWRKMRVYATHYDQYCNGCDQWTAIGMKAGKGVIAVDPKVIKLRSQVYVPGYGKAIAGDTGGAIKGNIIDLGYDDAKTAGWSARYVDIYLIDKAPQ